MLSQLVGLLILDRYIDKEVSQVTGNLTYKPITIAETEIERPEVKQSTSFIYILLGVLLGTSLVLLLIKFRKQNWWRFWFLLSVFLCLTIAFSAFINKYLAIFIAIVLALWKIYRPNIIIHNLTEVFIYGGLAAIFVPILNLFSVFMLLIIISFYDMYAVWKSKHMIKLANFQSQSKVFAGLLIPYKMKPINMHKKKSKTALKKKVSVKVKSAILGGGDIAFPLLFSGVVMKAHTLWETMIISFFAALGLFVLLEISQKDKFYPAMPFITIGSFVGYIVVILL